MPPLLTPIFFYSLGDFIYLIQGFQICNFSLGMLVGTVETSSKAKLSDKLQLNCIGKMWLGPVQECSDRQLKSVTDAELAMPARKNCVGRG